jgi:N-acyl-D-aspartate/D-glutamate deacylase
MGADSVGGQPTEDQLARMVQVLHESIEAGGLGFSTTLSHTHSDGDGNPVPSRHAKREEVLALCAAVSEHEGTTLEGIVSGCLDKFSEDEVDLLTAMSAAANRPINWNVLTVDKAAVKDRIPHQLEASSYAEKNGARIIALTMPVVVPMNMSLRTFCALFLIPGWADVLSLPIPERMAKLQDPAVRQDLLDKANAPGTGVLGRLSNFKRYVLGDTFAPENAGLKGRVVGEIAAERGVDPFTALVDIAVKDELKTVLWPMQDDNDDETWALRRDIWEDPRVMLGGSDAGAHLDRMCGAPYTTRFLGDMIRGRKLLSIERAVNMITDVPAQTFGIRDRGRVQEGYHADICVFDPEQIGSEDATLVPDLPGGAARLTAGSFGVVRVLVNGVETVVDGKPTDATPGTLLRSGRDTYTVSTA